MSAVPTDAQSRIEKLLSDLLNGNTSDISPQSRNEALLLGLINGDNPDITPVSRIECYLKALCEKNANGAGGGSPSASPNDVNFYDYDGMLVASNPGEGSFFNKITFKCARKGFSNSTLLLLSAYNAFVVLASTSKCYLISTDIISFVVFL